MLSFHIFDLGYSLLFPSLDILMPLKTLTPLSHVLVCRKERLETNDTVVSNPGLDLFHLIDNDMFSSVSVFLEALLANFFILPQLTSTPYKLLNTQVPDECFINMYHIMSLCFYPLIASHHIQNKAPGFPTLSLQSSMLLDFCVPLWSLSITFC